MALTAEQQRILEQANAPQGSRQLTPAQAEMLGIAPTESQGLRTFMQGATGGWAEEAEAWIRAAVPGAPEYSVIRDQLREKIRAYKSANPSKALTQEILGGLTQGVLVAAFTRQPAAAASVMANLRRLAGVGAAEGAIAGAGYSEGQTVPEVAGDVATTAAEGAVLGPAIGGATQGGGLVWEGFMNYVRQKFGDRPATAVQSELLRLAQDAGKTPDEIVADIADGRIMAENRTLQSSVRAYKSAGGEPAATLDQGIRTRRTETRRAATDALNRGLSPTGRAQNMARWFDATDDALRKAESDDYKRVFDNVPQVDQQTGLLLQDVLQRFPEVRSELGRYYEASSLVPLYKVGDNGAISIVRAPTLEDADVAYRLLRDETDRLFRSGSGTMADVTRQSRDMLKQTLDAEYPQLQAIRDAAALRRRAKDAFKEGKRAFSMNLDELGVQMDRYQGAPETLAAFRAGALMQARNAIPRRKNIFSNIGDPDSAEAAVLDTIFPEASRDEMARLASIAGDAQELYQRVLYGSGTAPQQAAASRIGTGAQSIEEATRAVSGDPRAIVATIDRVMQGMAPQLDDAQRGQVVRTLLSQDPQFVRRMLTGQGNLSELQARIGQLVQMGGRGVQSAAINQAGQENEYMAPRVEPGIKSLMDLFGGEQ